MKILWLKSEILHPIDKGGKIRSYQTLKYLKRDHQITYVSFRQACESQESLDRAAEYADRLITVPLQTAGRYTAAFYADLSANLASALPYAIQKYRSNEMRKVIERVLAQQRHHLLVSDFLTPCVNLGHQIGLPSVVFQHNVESQLWERQYQNTSNPVKKAYMYGQFRKMARFEGEWLRNFDGVIAVSELDRQTMRSRFGVDNVYCVPTGVDTAYFAADPGAAINCSELLFIGSMDYTPNEDAITYFAGAILPKIAAVIPDVSLTVVGRHPAGALLALSRSNPRITVTGAVPDVRPYLARAACVVAPLRIGSGTRLKIFEAMSMAKPVVATPVGAEGLPVLHGKHLLIGNGPMEFARQVIQVLTDRHIASRIARQARALVARQFGWESAGAEFARICAEIVSSRRRSTAA